MFADVPLFPEQASALAERVDYLFFALIGITGSVTVVIVILILYFSARYHRRGEGERTPRIEGSTPIEIAWSIIPLFIFLGIFYWGADVFSTVAYPPPDAMEVYVVGKQWMWKIQHPDGQREINELHLPVGRAVKLTLTSEDVIHDFFVPAFRTKVDVLPGRYVYTWYQPTKVGRYHLFCSQYCGTSHSNMIGTVTVMEPSEYEAWLNSHAEGSLALQGRKLFLKLQCLDCHSADSRARAPVLESLFGRQVHLDNGRTVVADEAYIRESILYPEAKIVQGWKPIMPTYKGQVNEEELIQLIAFIKALGPGQTPARTEDFPPPIGAPTKPEQRPGGNANQPQGKME